MAGALIVCGMVLLFAVYGLEGNIVSCWNLRKWQVCRGIVELKMNLIACF